MQRFFLIAAILATASCTPGSLIPESTVRATYMQSCGTAPEKTAYCECTYTELMKRVTVDDFSTPESEKMKKAVQEAVAACTSKLPTSGS